MSRVTRTGGYRGRSLVLPLFLMAVVTWAGCAGVGKRIEPTDSFPTARDVDVRFQPGDMLRLKFSYWPELDDEQVVRPDGKIALQWVGEVQAAGVTPEELRQRLIELYSGKLKKPDITVIAKALDGRRVYVGGEVRAPGVVPMTGPLSVLEAIVLAGGFLKESAQLRNVVIIRKRDGKEYAQSVDVRQALRAPERTPFLLEPMDMVYVPRTRIDKVDQWVEQYVNKVIPRNVHASFTFDRVQQDAVQSQPQVQIQTPAF